MTDIILQLLPTAGPYMGAALVILIFQVGVVARISNKRARLVLYYGSAVLLFLALALGLMVAALKDIH